ncbi:hypothetical protein [Aegicerativicinus sediminis]|uniref:hypothetical protein n=1 Tax=Aegicerativicinus sediminis TaxID=2893202 RepID=UPI001E45675F|nr:hypothetical protein [Aegicerativicinus sediminis]
MVNKFLFSNRCLSLTILLLVCFGSLTIHAQEEQAYTVIRNTSETQEEEQETLKRHKLALYLGSSLVPEGRSLGTNENVTLLAPTFGFSYEYWIAERWAIGTYNDIEIINLLVEEEEGNFLERENAVVLTLGLTYELMPRLTVTAGGGLETDKNETLGVVRLGSEYVLLEKNEWELSATLNYIHKDVYEIFGFGLVFGKRF